MLFLFKMSIRNIWRNPGRTLITSVAVVMGVMMMVLGWGFIDGLDENFLRASSQVLTGDVLLRPPDYPDDGSTFPLEKAQLPPDLSKVPGSPVFSARVQFKGRLIKGADSTQIIGVGYEPEKDEVVFPRKNWHVDGVWPVAGQSQIAIGERLSRLLGTQKGDSLVLEARTQAGAVNAWTYTVTALVKTDNALMDGSAVWLTMQDAESLLFLEGKRTHIAILSRNPEGLKQDLEPYLKGWVATTVREECAELLEINEFRRRALLFMVFIIMAIAATGILNSVLMAAFERIREIGALRALGMTQGGVATMFLLEGTFLGTLAGVVGAILGILLVIHWENNGFTISDAQMQTAGELSIGSMIFTKFSWSGPIRSVIFALIISLLAVIYPIWFATRLNPADAVRSE